VIETWKEVPGYDGFYDVSDLGQVRSWKVPGHEGYRSKAPKPMTSAWRWGYLSVHIRHRGVSTSRPVHVLVLESFVGPRPEGHLGCHGDGDRSNCRLDNLYWGTHAQNMDDRERHGRTVRGERHHAALLTEDQVTEIKGALSDPYFGQGVELAARYGVSAATISAIKHGRLWASV